MQSVSSRIWTRVTVSISYDDNHYTTGTNSSVSWWSFNGQQVSSSLQDSSHNSIVWKVSIRRVISKSSSPCINPLLTVLMASITTDITITFMFHSFFNSKARSRYLSFILLSFNFTLWSAGTAKSAIRQVIIIIIIILLIWEFFKALIADGFPLESDWQQVTSNL